MSWLNLWRKPHRDNCVSLIEKNYRPLQDLNNFWLSGLLSLTNSGQPYGVACTTLPGVFAIKHTPGFGHLRDFWTQRTHHVPGQKTNTFWSWKYPRFERVLRPWAGPSLAESLDTIIKTVSYFGVPKSSFLVHFQTVVCDIFRTEMLHTGVNWVFYNLNKCVPPKVRGIFNELVNPQNESRWACAKTQGFLKILPYYARPGP